MPRSLTPALRRAIEEPRSDELLVVMLEIEHVSINPPIRVANDVVSYSYQGNVYIGFPFEIEIISDSAQVPRGNIRIQNVDQRMSEAIRELTEPPRLSILIFASSDFGELDEEDGVRYADDDAEPEYEARHLIFGNASVDVMTISGEIVSFDMTNEPWPAPRSTADRLPGLDP